MINNINDFQKKVNLLLNKRGYLKWGAKKLSKVLNVTKEDVIAIKKEVYNIIQSQNTTSTKETKDKLVVAQIWEKPNGDRTIHYKNASKETLDIKEVIETAIKNSGKGIIDYSNVSFELNTENKYFAVLSIPDVHIGQYDINLSFQDQLSVYKETVIELFHQAYNLGVNKVIFPIGSDYFNVDTVKHTTTNYTQQHNSVDWQIMYRDGLTAIIDLIEYMSQFVHIQIVGISGNHDEALAFALTETIKVMFKNVTNVSVDNNVENPRKYILEGNTLIGITHGKDESLNNLPNLMALEAKHLWGKAEFRDFFHGHHHHEVVKDVFATRIIGLSSLANANKWAKSKGYVSSANAQVYVYSYTQGPKFYIQKNITN